MELPQENVHTTIENDISRFLPHVSAYGAFYSQVLYWSIDNPANLGTKLEGVLFDKGYVNALIYYLVDLGFASRRYDIETEFDIIISLTEKGRKLKDAGSIIEFSKTEAYDKRKEYLQDQRAVHAHYNQIALMILTGIAALYSARQMWVPSNLYPIFSYWLVLGMGVFLGILWSNIVRMLKERRPK